MWSEKRPGRDGVALAIREKPFMNMMSVAIFFIILAIQLLD
jgi:hypothetical protein